MKSRKWIDKALLFAFSLLIVTSVTIAGTGSARALASTNSNLPISTNTASSSESAESSAESGDTEAEISDEEAELLQTGLEAFNATCASCHQAGGIGLEGQYPPLKGNDNAKDEAHVRDVIENGLSGELVVAGVTYNGVMPSFSTLSEKDTTAIVAYLQNDLVAPVVQHAEAVAASPVTKLPGVTGQMANLALIIAAVAAGVVFAPNILASRDRLRFPKLDAWLRTAIIVIAAILLTAVIPDWAIKTKTVTGLNRFVQDLVGVTLWSLGLVVLLFGLWHAHREDKI